MPLILLQQHTQDPQVDAFQRENCLKGKHINSLVSHTREWGPAREEKGKYKSEKGGDRVWWDW